MTASPTVAAVISNMAQRKARLAMNGLRWRPCSMWLTRSAS